MRYLCKNNPILESTNVEGRQILQRISEQVSEVSHGGLFCL